MIAATNSPHVVAIGGGGGATQVLRAVEPFAGRRTAIIAVTDTGRSTGLARQIGGIPAPGDLRATIAAFARNRFYADLLQQRFDGAGIPQLEGMAFGNLLLAALGRQLGDFAAAVAYVAHAAECAIEVLPVAAADTQLCAELEDGTFVEGELAVRGLNKPYVRRLFLQPPTATDPRALAAIHAADLVVIGPGSLFTTVLANLQFAGLTQALQETPAQVAYLCNTTTQSGQTDGFRTIDHVRRLVEVLGPGTLDIAVINRSTPDPAAVARYAAQGLHLLTPDDAEIAEIAALGVRPVVRALTEQPAEGRVLWNKQDTIRHDTALLGAVLAEITNARTP